MDLRHMRHFVAVAEELHFGRAARRLNMAQPPLSQAIRRLEADLGVELFDRSRRSVELTDAGRVFLVEARRTLSQAELARTLARRQAEKVPEVRVAFVGPALYRVLPDLLVRHRRECPDILVRLFERASPDQVAGLGAGEFDVGFITTGVERPAGCETRLVERAPFVAAVPADWPVAHGRTSVSLAELAGLPFIRPPPRYAAQYTPAAAESFAAAFQKAGVMPHVTQEATQTNTSLSLVGAGLGCSLVMATAELTGARNVRFLPIEDPGFGGMWELVMVWLPDHLGRLGQAFVAFVEDYVRDNPQLLEAATTIG